MNEALRRYSHAMGNRKADLSDYLADVGEAERLDDLVAGFRALQNGLFARAEAENGGKPVSGKTLESMAMSLMDPEWLDDRGRTALVEWLVWMCWHEGLLAGD